MSRKLILSVALSGLVSTAMAQTTVAPAIPRDENIEKKVEALLEKMTLEEKIGQMTELTIDVITKRDNPTKEFQIDDALLDTVIGKYKVGSILNVPQGIAQSKEKWEEIIKKIQDKSMKTMGIPCIYGVDQIHGTTYTLGGTFFPQGINMALHSTGNWFVKGPAFPLTKLKPVVFPGHMLPCSTWLAMPAGPVIGKIMARIAM